MADISPKSPPESRADIAFPTLSDPQVAALEPFGKLRTIPKGDYVWHAGDPNLCMFLIVEGEMNVVDGRTEHPIAVHRKGNFSGDIDVLTGRPVVVSAIAGTDLKALEIPAECTRTLVAEVPELGTLILQAFLMRRVLLRETGEVGPLVVGSRYSPDSLRIREFLSRNRYPFTWHDLETQADTQTLLKEFNVTEDQTPLVVLPNGQLVLVPSNAELAEALGVIRPVETKAYDLIIVGAGPAGLAAGVYGASEGLSTLIVDSIGPGGQAGTSSRIENYMGFPLGISGQDLADGAIAQAEKFGAQMISPATVTDITCDQLGGHIVKIDGVGDITARCVILAAGASYRKLDIDDLEKYEGRGVYYAATNVERSLCTDSSVAVVGAGNSAGQAAVYMADEIKEVFLVVRGDDLRRTMSSYLARRIEHSSNIKLLLNSEICELHGEERVRAATIVDRKTRDARTEEVAAVFVMIGAVPKTGWLPTNIKRDQKGFVLTGPQLLDDNLWVPSRPPFFLETSCPGVFAVGDARSNSIKRVASAVGEGSMAVAFAHQFLAL